MYSAKIEGKPTTFGTSGLLYRSNKLMYDRTTRSIWSQLLGEPVIGTLADSRIKLDFFPVNLTTWQEWREQHPDTTVLSRNTGVYPPEVYESETAPSSFYFEYRNSPRTMFPIWQRDDSLNTKDQVIIVRADGVSKAYSLQALQSERVVNDQVGGVNVVLVSGSVHHAGRGGVRARRRGVRPAARLRRERPQRPAAPGAARLRRRRVARPRARAGQATGAIARPDPRPLPRGLLVRLVRLPPRHGAVHRAVASGYSNRTTRRASSASAKRLSVASDGFAEPLSSREMTDCVVFIFRATSC